MSSSTVRPISVAPMSISVAPIFLTRPFLFFGIKPAVVSAITTFLQEFLRISGEESRTLKLQPAILPSLPEIVAFCNADTTTLIKAYFGHVHTVDSSSIASADLAVPIPLALACHFFGIVWNDWFMSLGGSEFELVLDPRCVYVVKKSDGCIGVVWTDMNISTGVIRHRSAIGPMHSTSTSLFSPIDNLDSEDAEMSTSRPSSRSSNYSTFSFSSHSSASSQSSIGSLDAVTNFKPFNASFPAKTPAQAFSARTTTTRSGLGPIMNTHCATAPVKVVPTRYLYQGGVSTVLTGGVMLGHSTQATCKLQTAPA